MKHKIEQLFRDYAKDKNPEDRKKIKKSIKYYFNLGCVIGKRGITALEIEKDNIRLVYWFDRKTSKRYLKNYGNDPELLDNSDYFRMIINEENLAHIFARINLLS
jgi:hypothetical protein